MKNLKFDCDVFCEPKEAWFLLPVIAMEIHCGCFTIAAAFLCFGVSVEISKEDE